ncbi:hypothetical protein L596_018860 [Steinernema carpocapsae]|uniref:Large ribosomal subunit protein mL45 n=1 Tax=Steinernema carpocapsae TaxID=34508 RepID=A0A4U5N647_STECR|nr:hypothetical protein L596_018860 [Steinernema carpocapsae]
MERCLRDMTCSNVNVFWFMTNSLQLGPQTETPDEICPTHGDIITNSNLQRTRDSRRFRKFRDSFAPVNHAGSPVIDGTEGAAADDGLQRSFAAEMRRPPPQGTGRSAAIHRNEALKSPTRQQKYPHEREDVQSHERPKTLIIDLPDDEETRRRDNMAPAEMRNELLRQVIYISLLGDSVVDPYVTPEDPLPFFDLSSPVDAIKMKGSETKERVLHRWHNYRNGVSRIRKKEGFEKFDPKNWGPTADDIYARAHEALMARDKPRLHKLITENAFGKMWPDVENGSIVWELVAHNEPSKVVSIRCADSPYKSGNDIAQLTVRMNTKQRLAVFDRFGQLLLGSEAEVRDCVEYVVFENHVSSMDGMWRLHDKVHPRWAKTKHPSVQTRMLKSDEERPATALSLPLRAEIIDQERRKANKNAIEEE